MEKCELNAREAGIGRREFIKLGAGAGMIMALDVPGASAQSANGGPASIDLHTHWVPEAYDKALAELKRPTPSSTNPLDFDLDKRRKWMDEHGVQMHVLTLSGGMPWQWVPPDVGAHLAQIINDAAMEAHAAFPDRFVDSLFTIDDKGEVVGHALYSGQRVVALWRAVIDVTGSPDACRLPKHFPGFY